MKKHKKTIIITIIFVAIAAGLLFYIFNGGQNGSEEPQNQSTVSEVDSTKAASEILSSESSFTKFDKAISQNGLTTEIDGQVTIFVPNNQAFDSLPETDKISESLDKDITGYHIVKGVYTVADLSDGQKLPTISGKDLVVLKVDEDVYILDSKGNKVKILTPDLKTKDGVIHEIESVFIPQ